MTVNHTATGVEIANILDKAAEYVEQYGWIQHALYDEAQAQSTPRAECRVCAIGAILAATYGIPSYPVFEKDRKPVEMLAETALCDFVNADHGTATVPQWNDGEYRTAEDVVMAFRGAAAQLRAEATA